LNAAEGFKFPADNSLARGNVAPASNWLMMPDYPTYALGNQRNLAGILWTGKPAMNCMSQPIGRRWNMPMPISIQRLMVTGNLLTGWAFQPKQICDWYLPGVYGMPLTGLRLPKYPGQVCNADGGYLGSSHHIISASGQ